MLHFALLGTAVFLVYGLLHPKHPDRVRATPEVLSQIDQQFTIQNGRPPTADELHRLGEQFLDDEVLYREALALGLDKDDPIVRRRLIQKMLFVSQDTATADEPSQGDLAAFWSAHPDRYREPPRTTFHQVFFTRERAGDAARAARALREHGPAPAGDAFVAGSVFTLRSATEIAGVFGPELARRVSTLAPGDWSDPIESSFGLHVVKVDERVPGRVLGLDEVRARVRADFMNERREHANEAVLRELRAKYGAGE